MKKVLSVTMLAVTASVSWAADHSPANSWLELQRSGDAASRVSVQAANEIEREKAVDRFLKTYDYPIPPSFYGSRFGVGR